MIRSRAGVALLLTVCSAALLSAGPAPAEEGGADDRAIREAHRRCARQFETAQREDMESFRDYDAETWREGHHPDAVSIFASGDSFIGIEAIMEAATRHFRDREAIWSWTEISRQVHGCDTALILYDAVYEIPSIGYHQRALTAVTYTYEHGRWLGVLDQGTYLEPPN